MPIALVNGVRLNYVQIGGSGATAAEGSREHLVALHGLAANLAFWYLHYSPVFAARFCVTLPDLRGHGRSEMPADGYDPASLARDLAGLLDHLRIDSAHLLAHSYGGVAALIFAGDHPQRVRSLVLADTQISSARRDQQSQRWPDGWPHGRRMQPMLERHGLKLDTRDPYFGHQLLTRVAEWRLQGFAPPAELVDLLHPLMGSTTARTAAQWLRLMRDTAAAAEIREDDGLTPERLRALRFPILAMYGDDSQARWTGDRLLELWPHAEFRRIRGAGHFFPVSRPEETLSCCEGFWSGTFSDAAARRRAGEPGSGEPARGHFRSDRVFGAEGAWYCATREDGRLGPFATRDIAAAAARPVASVQA